MEVFSNIILYFFSFLVVLSIIVFVHEFGHYLAAILNKVKVETFSIGFGKEIFGWYDRRGTRWKISLLPFGGYVKMFGEDPFSSKKIQKKDALYAFSEKTLLQRFIIVFAGPLANFIFAIIGFAIIYTFIGINQTLPIVNQVQVGSPAEIAGIKSNDHILSIDDNKIKDFQDIGRIINLYKRNVYNFEIQRNDKKIYTTISPVYNFEEIYGNKTKVGKIGVSAYKSEIKKYNFAYSTYLGVISTYNFCSLTLKALNQLIIGKGSLDDLGGPVKIAHFSGKMLEQGVLPFINLIIFLSVSIGLINLFPIPVLDGGHLVFYIIEGILGKPINKKTQALVYKFGFILIISLAILLTYNDIISLF